MENKYLLCYKTPMTDLNTVQGLDNIRPPANAKAAASRRFRDAFAAAADSDLARELRKKRNQARIEHDLTHGIIPDTIAEQIKLVPLDSPEAKEFQTRMEAITKRLFASSYSSTLHQFRFVISDSDIVNAGIYTDAKPPIVLVTKGLLQVFETEDQLAAALAHELTHQAIFDRIGKHHNSNPEESVSDVWAVHLMQRAGYNPMAMLEVMRKIEEAEEAKRKETKEDEETRYNILRILDPHPPTKIRQRNIENAIAIVEQKEKLNVGAVPMDEDWRAAVMKGAHESFLQRRLREAGYEGRPLEERIAMTADIAMADYVRGPAIAQQRRPEMVKHLKALAEEADKAGCKDLFLPFQYALLAIGPRYNHDRSHIPSDFMNAIVQTGAPTLEARTEWQCPPGIFKPLFEAMKGFVEAADFETAHAHATVVNQYAGTFDLTRSWYMNSLASLPQFKSIHSRHEIAKETQDGKIYEFPWNRHRRWGTSGKDGADEIMRALYAFNIKDGLIQPPAAAPRIFRTGFSYNTCNYDKDDLRMDADGMIFGLKNEENKRFKNESSRESDMRASEAAILDRIDASGKEAAATANWAEMGRDIGGFVKQHKTLLEPQLSLLDKGHSFIDAFVGRLEALYDENPRRYGPVINRFLCGYGPLQHAFVKAGGNAKPNPSSLPGLIESFQTETWYRGNEFMFETVKMRQGKRPRTEKIRYRKQKGMAPTHPYVRLLIKHGAKAMTPVELGHLVEDINIYRDRPHNIPEKFITLDFRALFGYEKPKNAAELIDVCRKLGTKRKDREAYDSGPECMLRILAIEIETFLVANKDEHLDFVALRNYAGLSRAQNPALIDEQDEEKDEAYLGLLEQQVRINSQTDLDPGKTTIDDLIARYVCYSEIASANGSLFTRQPALRKTYEDSIRTRIDAIPGNAERREKLEKVLFTSSLNDPDFRSWAVDSWVVAQGDEIRGKAIGSRELRKLAEKVMKGAQKNQSVNMLSGLLDYIEAGEKDSFMVRDMLVNHLLRRGGSEDGLLAAANDHIMDNLSNNQELRDCVLHFLTEPLNDKSALDAYEAMHKVYIKDGRAPESIRKFFSSNIHLPDDAKIELTGTMHRNFWSLPFAARTIYIERVLFPVDETKDDAFDKAVAFVLDRVLPPGKPYSDEARLILSTHMEGCSKPLQRLIISALITASEKKAEGGPGQDGEIRPGQVLSLVLGKTGAAGGKILQAVHSYLQSVNTDDPNLIQFRDDLKASKSDFNRPFRWDIFSRLNAAVPQKIRKTMAVGRLLGAGSYGYTVQVARGGKRPTALTLLRGNVEYEAQHQFEHYRSTAEKLSKHDAKWEPLIGILANARDMARIEADFTIGAKQIRAAEKLYNGYKITADGQTFKIRTAALCDHGKEYKETRLAKGVHFNDLPAATAQDRAYRQAVAKAVFTAEIGVMLSGAGFDYDRHGAQQRVAGGTITLFDHGSLMYDLDRNDVKIPTEEEKQTLGTIIASVYKTLENGEKPVIETLLDHLRDTSVYGGSAGYIESFKRGILALGDYRQHMGDTDEARNKAVAGAIMAVITSGSVDPVIQNTVIEAVDPTGALRKDFKGAQQAAKDGLIPALPQDIAIISHGQAAFENRKNLIRAYIVGAVKQGLERYTPSFMKRAAGNNVRPQP